MDVLTNRALAAAALSTLAQFAALPGPPQSCVTWCEETDAPYLFVPGDVTAIDGVTSIAPTGGTAGRWLLGSEKISIAPIGGAADDWPRFIGTIVAACAYKCKVEMRFGTWTTNTPNQLVNGTTILAQPGVRIISTIAPSGGQTSSVFSAGATTPAGAVDTTTAAQILVNDRVITLTSIAIGPGGANAVVGSTVIIGETNRFFYYEVTAVNVGARQITLDRPTVTAFAAGVAAGTRVDVRDITIDLANGSIEGTGDRAINLPAANRCLCQRIIVKPNVAGGFFSDSPVSYDIGGRFSKFSNIHVDSGGLGLHCMTLESAESCEIEFCELRRAGATFASIALGVAYYCKITSTNGMMSPVGLLLNSGGGADIYGCRSCTITDSDFRSNTTAGIVVQNGSSFNSFVGVSAVYNGTQGIFIANGTNNAEPTRNNTFTNCDVSRNGTSGVQTFGATGTTKDSRDTTFTNLLCIGGGGLALDCGGSVIIDGLDARENPGGVLQVTGAASARVRNVNAVDITTGAFWAAVSLSTTAGISTAGDISISGLRITVAGAGTKVCLNHTAGLLIAEDVRIVSGAPTLGYASAASANARFRRGPLVNLAAAATPYAPGAGSLQNWGTSPALAAGTIVIANAMINATDRVQLLTKAPAGVPGVLSYVVAAGVSLTINTSGGAGDTSTVDWWFDT